MDSPLPPLNSPRDGSLADPVVESTPDVATEPKSIAVDLGDIDSRAFDNLDFVTVRKIEDAIVRPVHRDASRLLNVAQKLQTIDAFDRAKMGVQQVFNSEAEKIWKINGVFGEASPEMRLVLVGVVDSIHSYASRLAKLTTSSVTRDQEIPLLAAVVQRLAAISERPSDDCPVVEAQEIAQFLTNELIVVAALERTDADIYLPPGKAPEDPEILERNLTIARHLVYVPSNLSGRLSDSENRIANAERFVGEQTQASIEATGEPFDFTRFVAPRHAADLVGKIVSAAKMSSAARVEAVESFLHHIHDTGRQVEFPMPRIVRAFSADRQRYPAADFAKILTVPSLEKMRSAIAQGKPHRIEANMRGFRLFGAEVVGMDESVEPFRDLLTDAYYTGVFGLLRTNYSDTMGRNAAVKDYFRVSPKPRSGVGQVPFDQISPMSEYIKSLQRLGTLSNALHNATQDSVLSQGFLRQSFRNRIWRAADAFTTGWAYVYGTVVQDKAAEFAKVNSAFETYAADSEWLRIAVPDRLKPEPTLVPAVRAVATLLRLQGKFESIDPRNVLARMYEQFLVPSRRVGVELEPDQASNPKRLRTADELDFTSRQSIDVEKVLGRVANGLFGSGVVTADLGQYQAVIDLALALGVKRLRLALGVKRLLADEL